MQMVDYSDKKLFIFFTGTLALERKLKNTNYFWVLFIEAPLTVVAQRQTSVPIITLNPIEKLK